MQQIATAILLILAATPMAWTQSNPLTITPSTVVFCGQPGQVISSTPVTISPATGPVTLVVTSIISEGNWLTVDPTVATVTTTPSRTLVLGINGGAIPFPVGTYYGQVLLGSFDGARLGSIPVVLQVGSAGCGSTRNALLSVNSGPLSFQLGPGTKLNNLILSLYNTFPSSLLVAPWATTSTNQKWLSSVNNNLTVVPGLMSPTPLGVNIDTTGLGAGPTYAGNIELDTNLDASLNIPISLVVNPSAGGASFVATPSPLTVDLPRGMPAASLPVQLTNLLAGAVNVSISTSNGAAWLSVSPLSALVPPNGVLNLTATVSAAGLNNGPNQARINVQATSGASGTFTIPVTVNYAHSPLSVFPNPLNITAMPGTTHPVTQPLTLSADSGILSVSTKAFSSVNQPWLSVSPYYTTVSPGSPVTLTVSVQPSLVPAGPAIGVITLLASDGSTLETIPVNVNSGTDSSLSVAPAQLSFTYQPGGPVPKGTSLNLSSTLTSNYSVQANSTWLTVSPGNVPSPANVTVQVNPAGLAPNTYNGQIVITNQGSGAQQIVPVTLTVGATLSANPSALAFTYQAGSGAPLPQAVQVTGGVGVAPFTAATAGLNGAPNFLTVTPSAGSTASTLMVGLNAAVVATLPAGQYSGAVTISYAGVPGGSQIVNVTLVVSPVTMRVDSIVNSASLQPGAVSPGEIVTLFGSGLGPSDGAGFSLTAQGTVPTTLAGVSVSFDEYPAALMYAGSQQINAIVPYEIAGRGVSKVVVARNGAVSLALLMQVADTAPAIFSGILNADNSYNNPSNPAAKGSVIQFFATGEGLYSGAATGAVTPGQSPFPKLFAPVTVTIGGLPAQVWYAGEAPGLISGVLQVNAVVDPRVASGPQPVMLRVGDNSNTPQTITLAVQ